MNIHDSCNSNRPSRAALAGSTVLLVEDSRHISDAVRLICRAVGVRMRRAADLRTAARHLGLYRPDAVLIDPGLPDGCGIELIETLARRRPRIPLLIALSGSPEHEPAARAAGADSFISKEMLTVDTLCAALCGHLALPDMTPGQNPDQSAASPAPGACNVPGARVFSRSPGPLGQPDPAALHDDLRLACDLLNGMTEPRRLHYAAGLVRGIASHLGDRDLLRASEEMIRGGCGGDLIVLLRARMKGCDPVWTR